MRGNGVNEKDGSNVKNVWDMELQYKPDFSKAMERVYAWYNGEIIDRAPVRFVLHNAEFNVVKQNKKVWKSLKDRWYDVEYQVETFIENLAKQKFIAETFPVFWPNIGPSVFSAFYGAHLEFGEITSWCEPSIHDLNQVTNLKLDMNSEYFQKIIELTDYALERCDGKFMVGYTDLHPGVDCVAAWRDPQELCMDFYDEPDAVKKAISTAMKDFQEVFDFFDKKLKEKKQLSVTWMGIPSFGKMHIPSCDFSSMISPSHFDEYCLPALKEEVKPMTHNIFHLDGKGVARHLDRILELPEIQAIQWVQGEGTDTPIMQWVPLINKIRNAGKSVVVNLQKNELDSFMQEVRPEGIFICVDASSNEEQENILRRIEKWK
jgi:hypothetical protein